jgi:hypothetical protein
MKTTEVFELDESNDLMLLSNIEEQLRNLTGMTEP